MANLSANNGAAPAAQAEVAPAAAQASGPLAAMLAAATAAPAGAAAPAGSAKQGALMRQMLIANPALTVSQLIAGLAAAGFKAVNPLTAASYRNDTLATYKLMVAAGWQPPKQA